MIQVRLPVVAIAVALALGAAYLLVAPAAADTAAPGAPGVVTPGAVGPGTTAPEGFIAATTPPEQSVPGDTLLVWAYAGIWTLLLVLLGALWVRQDALRREIDRLRERLGERPGAGGAPGGAGGKAGGSGGGA